MKDEETLGWLVHEDPRVREAWAPRTAFIRLTDRIIEGETLEPGALGASTFVPAAIAYLEASRTYTTQGLQLFTLAAHDRMLLELGGGAFRLLPFAAPHDEIASFGALDQLWNNVRDLQEDLDRGLCYFPADVLARHGLRWPARRAEFYGTRWKAMMLYWLNEYAPAVRGRAEPFIRAAGLHPSLERFRASCMSRYERIERVFRKVGFDYDSFPVRYWT